VKVLATELPGVVVVEPVVHRDARGFFLETWRESRYHEHGIDVRWVQDNHSRSMRGALRGLHAQLPPRAQDKLLRCIAGEIFDVAVDVRRGSPTFGLWAGVVLSAENFRQLFVPAGFAHGFCVTSESAEVEYKCSEPYSPEDEIAIAWNDPAIGIRWPIDEPTLSSRDAAAPTLAELARAGRLPPWPGTA
jgi:dTDP-4-dehydrorhamnose 3,5-epimerase